MTPITDAVIVKNTYNSLGPPCPATASWQTSCNSRSRAASGSRGAHPSIRQSCKTHGLSPMTVLQAYQLLESRGLILARPQSGYYVKAAEHGPAGEPAPRRPATAARWTSTIWCSRCCRRASHGSWCPWAWRWRTRPSSPPPARSGLGSACAASIPSARWQICPRQRGTAPRHRPALRRTTGWRWIPSRSSSPRGPMGALPQPSGADRARRLGGGGVPTFYGALQAIERLKLKVVEIPVIPGWASISPCWPRPRPAPHQGVLADGQRPAPLGHTMPDGTSRR